MKSERNGINPTVEPSGPGVVAEPHPVAAPGPAGGEPLPRQTERIAHGGAQNSSHDLGAQVIHGVGLVASVRTSASYSQVLSLRREAAALRLLASTHRQRYTEGVFLLPFG